MSLGLLIVCSVTLPFYWLAEPGRQDGAVTEFDRIARVRGERQYVESCTACHGAGGGAGAASVTLTDDSGSYVGQVDWAAPALNTVLSRFSEEEVIYILNFGRAGVMPAWGAPGGGPLTEQQIENLVVYLRSVQLTEEEIQENVEQGVRDGKRELLLDPSSELGQRMEAAQRAVLGATDDTRAAADGEVAAINDEVDAAIERFLAEAPANAAATPGTPAYDQYLEWGELLFTNRADGGVYGCARCHTAGWSYQAADLIGLDGEPVQDGYLQGSGAVGPNLTNGATTTRFETFASHATFIANGSEDGVGYGSNDAPATGSGGMPGFGGRTDDDLAEDWAEILTEETVVDRPGFFIQEGGELIVQWAPLLTSEQLDAVVAVERSWQAEGGDQ